MKLQPALRTPWLLLVLLASAIVMRAATVRVAVDHLFGDTPLRLGELAFTNSVGDTLSVTRLDYLLSDFALVTERGNAIVLTNQCAYLSVGGVRTGFELGEVPAGRFTKLRFRIGLAPVANHGDPARFAAGHPLNPNVNGLHWSWQGGYVFLALEGNWRTPDGSPSGYSYHLATDELALPGELPMVFEATNDLRLQLTLDVAKIFSGPNVIRLSETTSSTHSRTNDLLARQLRDNVVQAFGRAADLSVETPRVAAPLNHVEIASGATPYRLRISRFFPQPSLPADNPLTEEGVALGRRLFLDPAFSVNGTQSCATCHQAGAAFTDAGKRFSTGAEGQTGTRNAMPLANLAWQSRFFWDGRAVSLREQVLQPVTNPAEMHESLTNVVRKLDQAGYAPAFAATFGTPSITADRMARALEQFLLTLTSHSAKFDQVLSGQATFTPEEQRGFELFHTEYDPHHEQFGADCLHCHGGPLFSDFTFHNNGLDSEGAAKELGRFLVTTNRADFAKFKTPSLRNVALTAPYMHDGRFSTLEEAVAHYCSGVQRSATLDPNLAKHPDGGVPLSKADQQALVAFLKTLTDSATPQL